MNFDRILHPNATIFHPKRWILIEFCIQMPPFFDWKPNFSGRGYEHHRGAGAIFCWLFVIFLHLFNGFSMVFHRFPTESREIVAVRDANLTDSFAHSPAMDQALPVYCIQKDEFCIQNDEFAFKRMNFAFKMMNFASKNMDSAFKMMNFVFKLMNRQGRVVERHDYSIENEDSSTGHEDSSIENWPVFLGILGTGGKESEWWQREVFLIILNHFKSFLIKKLLVFDTQSLVFISLYSKWWISYQINDEGLY